MSEQKVIYCPRCGAPRTNNGVFCGGCGYQLIDGQAHMRAYDTRRRVPKDNLYANRKAIGYSTYWQTEGTERKVVTAIMYTLMACLLVAVIAMFMRNFMLGIVLFVVTFVGFALTVFISSRRKSNQEQIKANGVIYKGDVHYKRNPITGEFEDMSNVTIRSASENNPKIEG